MAEKTTKKAPAAQAAAASATAPAANATGTTTAAPAKPAAPKTIDTFKFVKPVAEGEKLAPQARVIVNVLADHKNGLTREDLSKALEGKLQTRQPIGRIVTYYQKTLVERGYITIDAVEVAA
jgi:hypothetical protein